MATMLGDVPPCGATVVEPVIPAQNVSAQVLSTAIWAIGPLVKIHSLLNFQCFGSSTDMLLKNKNNESPFSCVRS